MSHIRLVMYWWFVFLIHMSPACPWTPLGDFCPPDPQVCPPLVNSWLHPCTVRSVSSDFYNMVLTPVNMGKICTSIHHEFIYNISVASSCLSRWQLQYLTVHHEFIYNISVASSCLSHWQLQYLTLHHVTLLTICELESCMYRLLGLRNKMCQLDGLRIYLTLYMLHEVPAATAASNDITMTSVSCRIWKFTSGTALVQMLSKLQSA